jgi:predicted TIM-barrel fold metal-dependent hydrolase
MACSSSVPIEKPARPESLPDAPLPLADHHSHVWSKLASELLVPPMVGKDFQNPGQIEGQQVVHQLDGAGVKKAAVLSVAYWFASPLIDIKGDRNAQLQRENDWVASEVAKAPNRLVGFCSFNPITDDALAQLNRCTSDRRMTGVKLHFGNSAVELENPEHARRVRQIFAAANRLRTPIIVHLWTLKNYGRADSEIFLDTILPAAPDITVQVAHLAGTGPGYGPDEAVAVFAAAMQRKDVRTRNLWFDVATVAIQKQTSEQRQLIVTRLRQIGIDRLLFGSDSAEGFNPPPGVAWSNFRQLPLSKDEIVQIANNTAPYLKP